MSARAPVPTLRPGTAPTSKKERVPDDWTPKQIREQMVWREKQYFDLKKQAEANIVNKTKTARRKIVKETPDVKNLHGLTRDRSSLIELYAAAGPYPPFPKQITPQQILVWAEATRDHYEDRGYYLTKSGLSCTLNHGRHPDGKHWTPDETFLAQHILYQLYREEGEKFPTPSPDPLPATTAQTTQSSFGIDIQRTAKRAKIYGYATGQIITWFGLDGWSMKEVVHVLKKLNIEVKTATLVSNISTGRNARTEPVSLTPEQIDNLRNLTKDLTDDQASPDHRQQRKSKAKRKTRRRTRMAVATSRKK